MKIVVVDYGMGNIKSIISTLLYLGINYPLVSSDYEVIKSANKLILPGVGSFRNAMENIIDKRLDEILKEVVLVDKKPILGICLGMQLLGLSSTEDGYTQGLKFVNAYVEKFQEINIKIPHVGFNQVQINPLAKLYKGIICGSDFYFTHSYKMSSKDYLNQSVCKYGSEFIASFEYENIAAVQFHPELSQNNGLTLLNNFINNF